MVQTIGTHRGLNHNLFVESTWQSGKSPPR
jgi:hypothetical protein